MLEVFYEDQDVIVVKKPAGIESQASHSFEADMVSEIRNYISRTSPAAGEPYVGVVHRLDKPVAGIMVYARSKAAAASLSAQVQNGQMKKKYFAVVCGRPVDNVGNFVDNLLKEPGKNVSKVVEKGTKGAKTARLRYRVLSAIQLPAPVGLASTAPAFAPAGPVSAPMAAVPASTAPASPDPVPAALALVNPASAAHAPAAPIPLESASAASTPAFPLSLVEIDLLTGRHHQIRVQFAAHGLPLWGDSRYNPAFARQPRPQALSALCGQIPASLALCACGLSFFHPSDRRPMTFSMEPEGQVFLLFAENGKIPFKMT